MPYTIPSSRDRPRVWQTMINFRITKVNTANDLIVYSARIQHVKSWQDLLPVLQAKGDLEKFVIDVLFKLGIHYDCSVTTNHVFIKEMPEHGLLPENPTPISDGGGFHDHDD